MTPRNCFEDIAIAALVGIALLIIIVCAVKTAAMVMVILASPV